MNLLSCFMSGLLTALRGSERRAPAAAAFGTYLGCQDLGLNGHFGDRCNEMADCLAMPSDDWRYSLSAKSLAQREAIWDLVAHASRWRDWSFLTRSYLLETGHPEPDGVGALRRFAVGPFGSSEEVVAFEPPGHLAYEARRGFPVRSYRADVRLSPEGGGTLISWSGALEPRVAYTGRLALAYARSVVGVLLRELVRFADGQAAGQEA